MRKNIQIISLGITVVLLILCNLFMLIIDNPDEGFYQEQSNLITIWVVFIALLLAINITLTVWVSKDSKAKSMNQKLWIILVLIFGVFAIIVYFIIRGV